MMRRGDRQCGASQKAQCEAQVRACIAATPMRDALPYREVIDDGDAVWNDGQLTLLRAEADFDLASAIRLYEDLVERKPHIAYRALIQGGQLQTRRNYADASFHWHADHLNTEAVRLSLIHISEPTRPY